MVWRKTALALLTVSAFAAPRAPVRDITGVQHLQKAAQRQRWMFVFMYDGDCNAASSFRPWLFALAQMVPNLAITRMDVSQEDGVVKDVFSVTRLPQVKLFVRDNPVGERIIDYVGPLEFESLFGWCKAVLTGKQHALSKFGVEPRAAQGSGTPSGSAHGATGNGGSSGSAMDKLPESVRLMAMTMVRETRLQRVLTQQGGGRLERYDAMVANRYQDIVSREGIDAEDKFAVQEANRRARDMVREEILVTAPSHIRDEIENDVNMGDMAPGLLPKDEI